MVRRNAIGRDGVTVREATDQSKSVACVFMRNCVVMFFHVRNIYGVTEQGFAIVVHVVLHASHVYAGPPPGVLVAIVDGKGLRLAVSRTLQAPSIDTLTAMVLRMNRVAILVSSRCVARQLTLWMLSRNV